MGIPAKQIGWGTESNLLWQIAKQLEQTACQLCTLNENVQTITGTSGTSGTAGTSGSSGTSGYVAYYGAFQDNTTQTTAGNENIPMKFDTTDISSCVSVTNDLSGKPTQLTIANTGVYDIQFSAQIQKTQGGQAQKIYIWLAKNGTSIPESNTALTLANNNQLVVAAWNFFVSATAGDKFQIMWRATDDHIELVYDDPIPGVIPVIPSVIVTVNKVS